MKLIVVDSIYEKEFKPLEWVFPIDLIKMAAKKSMCGLGENIKNSSKIPSTILKKVYLTSSGGAGRVVFLLQVGGDSLKSRCKHDYFQSQIQEDIREKPRFDL